MVNRWKWMGYLWEMDGLSEIDGNGWCIYENLNEFDGLSMRNGWFMGNRWKWMVYL